MITRIDLEKFKCFDILKLPLSSLTVLSGANASGKSSVLQSFALLHQTIRENEWSRTLILNGTAAQLGTVLDVVDKVHGRYECRIGLIDRDSSYRWTFRGDRTDMSMPVERVVVDGVTFDEPDRLRYLLPLGDKTSSLSLRLRDLSYITAERLGPREVYTVYDPQIVPVVGSAGEYAVSVLHSRRDEKVCLELVLPDNPATIMRQTEARMRVFFPGCEMVIQTVPHTNAVTIGFRTSKNTDFHRPIHAGFGLTQILPIVVASLSASREDILLIENPEVHLHPAGQALMGEFMAEVAQAGVQVILETHSDHVLNGIRRAVKAGKLSCEHVSIHFFKPRSSDSAQVVSPVLDSTGNIDMWPEGFFDQFDNDMNQFAGWE